MARHASTCRDPVDLVGTETGMLHRLAALNATTAFVPVRDDAVCSYMKAITLPKLYRALRDDVYVVNVPPDVADRARASIDRMLAPTGRGTRTSSAITAPGPAVHSHTVTATVGSNTASGNGSRRTSLRTRSPATRARASPSAAASRSTPTTWVPTVSRRAANRPVPPGGPPGSSRLAGWRPDRSG